VNYQPITGGSEWQTPTVNARSALFDLYGDHLRDRGGAAPVAALVRILGSLDIAAPAVRTAISRMVRQGWLAPTTLDAGPGYRLTPAANRRLSDAAERIYRTSTREWDGCWHLLVLNRIADRSRRDRVSNALAYLGFGRLAPSTWIGTRRSAEVDDLLAGEHVDADRFVGRDLGAPAAIAARAWDLDALAEAYRRWHHDAAELVEQRVDLDDEAAFVVRTQLVHEWRKFLFRDPGLPPALLPPTWSGHAAAAFFDKHAGALRTPAARYVDRQLNRRGDA
jgi:phenylacetic acid degradation operon negative regulatory protein